MTPRPTLRGPGTVEPVVTRSPLHIPGSAGEAFGHVLRTRRAGRFLFRESCYPAALRTPTHYHSRAYFSFVAAGGVREMAAGEEREYGAGSVHFHPAGDPHAVRTGPDGATCLSIVLAGDFGGGIGPLPRPPRAPGWLPAARLARACRRELSAGDSAADLALEAFALELLATFLRGGEARERRMPGWLPAVREHLHARFQDRIRLAELAALAGVHEVHLVRAFRAHLGVTPGGYVRRLRIERACAALAGSDQPIVDLALAAGFSSQAHFTRVFHRLTGTTPAAYRRNRAPRRP